MLNWQEGTDFCACDWNNAYDSCNHQDYEIRRIRIEYAGDNLKYGTDDKSIFPSKLIRLGGKYKRNNNIANNDSKLYDTNLLSGEILELQILDHDNGNHTIREHTECSCKEEKKKVSSFLW